MTSLAVLGIGIAIVWLVFWVVQNENAPSVKEQRGLFKMRDWTEIERAKQEEDADTTRRLSKRINRPADAGKKDAGAKASGDRAGGRAAGRSTRGR